MQMRSGGPAGGADIADYLALFDTGARRDAAPDFRQVCVGGVISAVVSNPDIAPIGTVPARLGHNAASGGNDRGACRRGEIDPFMH